MLFLFLLAQQKMLNQTKWNLALVSFKNCTCIYGQFLVNIATLRKVFYGT